MTTPQHRIAFSISDGYVPGLDATNAGETEMQPWSVRQ